MVQLRVSSSLVLLLMLLARLSAEEVPSERRLLAKIPPDLSCAYAVFSPDGKRVAWWAVLSTEQRIIVGEERGKAYADVGLPVFSPDGARVAYKAKREKGGKAFAVVDGQEGPEFDQIGEILFSPNGSRVTYAASENGKQIAVLDGERQPYECRWPPSFSPRGAHVYVGKKEGSSVLVVDGRPGELWAEIRHPVFSQDGARTAFSGRRTGEGARLVVDGVEGKPYDLVEHPIFCADGNRAAYIARRGETWLVVSGDEEIDALEGVSAPIILSDDGLHVAFQARRGEGAVVVRDGEVLGEEYDVAGLPSLSPDGKRLGWWAMKGETWRVVVDGVAGPERGTAGRPGVFSPDGQHFAYLARDHGSFVVVLDGEATEAFDRVFEMRFSSDSSQFAFGAQRGDELWWEVVPVR